MYSASESKSGRSESRCTVQVSVRVVAVTVDVQC